VGGNVPVDSEALLVTDFMNLKIKPAQSFGGAHRGKLCVRVFIGVSDHTCMSICVCTVFLKKGIDRVFISTLCSCCQHCNSRSTRGQCRRTITTTSSSATTNRSTNSSTRSGPCPPRHSRRSSARLGCPRSCVLQERPLHTIGARPGTIAWQDGKSGAERGSD
jgi:hypothetical protein